MKIQYIRRRRNFLSPRKKVPVSQVEKVGVMVAFPSRDGVWKFGWSLKDRGDKFDRALGRNIAAKRAVKVNAIHGVPHSIKAQFDSFIERISNRKNLDLS